MSVSLYDEGKLWNDTSKLWTEAVSVQRYRTRSTQWKERESVKKRNHLHHRHNHVLLFILLRVFDLWSLHLHCILHLASPKNPLESVTVVSSVSLSSFRGSSEKLEHPFWRNSLVFSILSLKLSIFILIFLWGICLHHGWSEINWITLSFLIGVFVRLNLTSGAASFTTCLDVYSSY